MDTSSTGEEHSPLPSTDSTEDPSTPTPASQSDDACHQAVHTLRNELHVICLQAHRAQSALQDGNLADLEQRLNQIKDGAHKTQELLDAVLTFPRQ